MTKAAFLVTALTGARRASLLGIALGLTWTTAAEAENLIFLSWPGLTGSVTSRGYEGTIALTSYAQNASNNLGKITCGAVTVMKFVDGTSPGFLGSMFRGAAVPSATVYFVHSVQTSLVTLYSIELRNVRATSITQSDSAAPVSPLTLQTDVHPPSETIVFSADQFLFSFNSTRFGWNCVTNSQI